jgi:DNA helicase-2/ATP-dependent DNA helicase PcrA
LEQLEAVTQTSEYNIYNEGTASRKARLEYVRERLRLFYVGITRARKELIVTWNSGRNGDQTQTLPFSALQGWFEDQR